MNNKLIEQYNVPVPRYTSYPPANFFRSNYGERDLIADIRDSNKRQPAHLSFYIHLPYCNRLCHYCGCNSYIRTRKSSDREYVEALLIEMDRVTELIDADRKIAQIHYGGGSPSTFDIELIRSINDRLLDKFDTIEQPEIAIECHPGYMREEEYEKLSDAGFNRMSIGIQDFNEEVLKAVNRLPSLIPPEELLALLKGRGIRTNLDFIYGLPKQTPGGFADTIARAIALQPERLVTFSYAHVPHLFPRQRKLEQHGLPNEEMKSKLYEVGQKLLTEGGYHQIGLDHFVRAEDELYQAYRNNTLHRNFQGYCTRRTTGQVYAFGVTAISQLTGAYAQNSKDINEYLQMVRAGSLPVKKGYRLSNEEQMIGKVITTLMCNEEVVWEHIAEEYETDVKKLKATTAYSEEQMNKFAADGLIDFDERLIRMRIKGSPYVRNVAASLDPLLEDSGKRFSKPI